MDGRRIFGEALRQGWRMYVMAWIGVCLCWMKTPLMSRFELSAPSIVGGRFGWSKCESRPFSGSGWAAASVDRSTD